MHITSYWFRISFNLCISRQVPSSFKNDGIKSTEKNVSTIEFGKHAATYSLTLYEESE